MQKTQLHPHHLAIKDLLLIALFFAMDVCFAQEEQPTLSADRPGYTWGTDVMPLHKISWENGFGYESETNGPHTVTLNTTIVRYGIFENVELRVGTDFLTWNDGQAMEPSFGVEPLAFGTKLKVYEGTRILPSVGLLAELKSPHIGSKELLPHHLAPSLYLIFENNINDWFDICYNVGTEWDGESATPTTLLSLSLNFSITERLGTFVESVNYFHPDDGNHYLTEFGLTWLVSPRVQLDLAADMDFQNLGKHYAISGGVAWLIN